MFEIGRTSTSEKFYSAFSLLHYVQQCSAFSANFPPSSKECTHARGTDCQAATTDSIHKLNLDISFINENTFLWLIYWFGFPSKLFTLVRSVALIATGLHLDHVFTLLLLMRLNFSSPLLPTYFDFYGRKTEYTEAKKDPMATSS